jgi:hypothetical protein
MSSLFLSYIRFDASVVSTFFFVENWWELSREFDLFDSRHSEGFIAAEGR